MSGLSLFGPPTTRDISVRKDRDGVWVTGCSDCWIFYIRDNWTEAMDRVNWHAIDRHMEATA